MRKLVDLALSFLHLLLEISKSDLRGLEGLCESRTHHIQLLLCRHHAPILRNIVLVLNFYCHGTISCLLWLLISVTR